MIWRCKQTMEHVDRHVQQLRAANGGSWCAVAGSPRDLTRLEPCVRYFVNSCTFVAELFLWKTLRAQEVLHSG